MGTGPYRPVRLAQNLPDVPALPEDDQVFTKRTGSRWFGRPVGLPEREPRPSESTRARRRVVCLMAFGWLAETDWGMMRATQRS
jgi:hypothetical protein